MAPLRGSGVSEANFRVTKWSLDYKTRASDSTCCRFWYILGSKNREPRPFWYLLGVKTNIPDEHPRPFDMGVPPNPPNPTSPPPRLFCYSFKNQLFSEHPCVLSTTWLCVGRSKFHACSSGVWTWRSFCRRIQPSRRQIPTQSTTSSPTSVTKGNQVKPRTSRR